MAIVRNYVLPAFVLLAILVAWDFTKPRMPQRIDEPPAAQPSPRPNDGVPPWNANEAIFQNGREGARKSALRGLDQAWSTYCTPAGRKILIDALSYYFEQRRQQEVSYPKRWGEEGRAYIEKEWSTPNDRRIERLVTETYERGYLDLTSLKPHLAKWIEPLVKDTRVQARPCKS